ncbi:MAG: cytochrome P450 [Acidimicrobiales bacterium]
MEPLDLSWGRTFANGFPHPFFAWLRREAPVWWHEPTEHTPEGEGFWVVSRYADVVAMFKDPDTFSSELGGTQIAASNGAGLQLNQTDDPHHRRLRALVNKGFTPRMIGRLEDDLRGRARAILDAVDDGAPFDFVSRVARELPLQAICGVLGVPQSDRLELCEIVDRGVGAETGEVVAMDAVRQLSGYARTLLETKRAEPADDILSIIVHAELDDGSRLTDKELRAFFNLLFPAGAETTRSAMAGGLVALMERPEQWRALQEEPARLKVAIEEIVRWTSPSVYKRRTTRRDVELGGRHLPAGSKVTLWEMSANHDEAVFADPFDFDIGRDPNPHVGFGLGTHFCLGASLARLEIKVMYEELLDRFDHLEPAGEPRWTNNNRLVGMTELPVRAVRRR